MAARAIFSHVDLRVRSRDRAIRFYDRLLGALGLRRTDGEAWSTYERDPASAEPNAEWFGFTEDSGAAAGSTRIAFAVASHEEVDRLAALAHEIGAGAIEGPEFAYGPQYYAVFFEDPDGNKLEICCIG